MSSLSMHSFHDMWTVQWLSDDSAATSSGIIDQNDSSSTLSALSAVIGMKQRAVYMPSLETHRGSYIMPTNSDVFAVYKHRVRHISQYLSLRVIADQIASLRYLQVQGTDLSNSSTFVHLLHHTTPSFNPVFVQAEVRQGGMLCPVHPIPDWTSLPILSQLVPRSPHRLPPLA
jgi:hypothetical protein